jgi:hypothetical protein
LTGFGLVVLVALILVGALLPLKYTARMHLPKPRPEPEAPPVRGRNVEHRSLKKS